MREKPNRVSGDIRLGDDVLSVSPVIERGSL